MGSAIINHVAAGHRVYSGCVTDGSASGVKGTNGQIKHYRFKDIVSYIENSEEFEMLDKKTTLYLNLKIKKAFKNALN